MLLGLRLAGRQRKDWRGWAMGPLWLPENRGSVHPEASRCKIVGSGPARSKRFRAISISLYVGELPISLKCAIRFLLPSFRVSAADNAWMLSTHQCEHTSASSSPCDLRNASILTGLRFRDSSYFLLTTRHLCCWSWNTDTLANYDLQSHVHPVHLH